MTSAAILEANTYHEEIIFACVSALAAARCQPEIAVYAPDHRRSREFLQEDLAWPVPWHPAADLADRLAGSAGLPDLVVVGTFPPERGWPVAEQALSLGLPVFALVHDIGYVRKPDGLEAALTRWPNLTAGYPGAAPARPLAEFDPAVRHRFVRFVPVAELAGAGGDRRQRTGFGLPGTIEFSRRDFGAALDLTARTRIPLRIFGRSRQPGDGQVIAELLAADRDRLLSQIEEAGVTPYVSVGADLPCRDFYRTLDSCRFIAILPVSEVYLRGKLTGAVTAALSCGVPMLADSRVHQFYTEAVPGAFSGCMLLFDGRAESWAAAADLSAADYERLCRAADEVRGSFLIENAATLDRMLTSREQRDVD